MKQSVRDAFVPFTAPMEGVVRWMYQDVKGLVTTAIGNLIDPFGPYVTDIPWLRPDGLLASRDEVRAEWDRVKKDPRAAKLGHRYTAGLTRLRLNDAGVDSVVSKKLAEMDAYLARRFPDWEDYPADAQLATLSMSWACGPAFRFPALADAIKRRDWDDAAKHCTIREAGNPGIVPRNVVNRRLYSNASRVQAFKLDPDTLIWPGELADLPAPNAATKPTTYPDFAIIHADPASYRGMWRDEDDDPDDVA